MQSAFIFCFVLHGYRFGKATIIYDILNNSKYYRKGAYVALHLKKKFHFQTFQKNFWLNFH